MRAFLILGAQLAECSQIQQPSSLEQKGWSLPLQCIHLCVCLDSIYWVGHDQSSKPIIAPLSMFVIIALIAMINRLRPMKSGGPGCVDQAR